MRFFAKLTLISLAMVLFSANVSAKNKEDKPIYAFGYSTNLNDTTLYLTSIQVLPGAELTKKDKFLEHRNAYGNQLKAHLESLYIGHEACAIFFSQSKKSLEKKYGKLRNHLLKIKHTKLTELSTKEFQFKAIEVQQ